MDILQNISRCVRKRLEQRMQRVPLADLQRQSTRQPHDFRLALQRQSPAIIAEIKFRSPSEGKLNDRLDPRKVALEYIQNGATALSILTEQDHFGGSLDSLATIRAQNPATPLLMKDFIVDEYQLFEARLLGADAILLIMALLGEGECRRLHQIATGLGLCALVEVHSQVELESAARIGANLIGINNRNLSTLEISLDTSRELIDHAPKNAVLVCESGISNARQIREFHALGFSAFLIGTSLMKGGTPGLILAQLVGELHRHAIN